jgi:hypothetical protein
MEPRGSPTVIHSLDLGAQLTVLDAHLLTFHSAYVGH